VFLEKLIQRITDPENLNVVRKIFDQIGPATPPPKKTASVEMLTQTFYHKLTENMRRFLATPTDDFEPVPEAALKKHCGLCTDYNGVCELTNTLGEEHKCSVACSGKIGLFRAVTAKRTLRILAYPELIPVDEQDIIHSHALGQPVLT
jgi:hypothetical protein